MTRRGLPPVAWGLLGILAVAAFVLSLGKREQTVSPTVDSYGPSGTSAFARSLERAGYRVRVDRRPRPQLAKGDLAIAFLVLNGPKEDDGDSAIRDSLRAHVRRGGAEIVFLLNHSFHEASRSLLAGEPAEVRDLGRKRTLKFYADPDLGDYATFSKTAQPTASLRWWELAGNDFVRAFRLGEGTVLNVRDGIAVTNRFIDRADDAEAGLALVRALVPAGATVVFAEATFGKVDAPSLMESIGPWAAAGWSQILFLGVVVVVTLGRRFGLPERDVVRQRSSRELLDALADTYTRGRHAQTALRTTVDEVESQVRHKLRLGRDAKIDARDERLPRELRQALAEAYGALTLSSLDGESALDIVTKLRDRTEAFVGAHQ